MNDDHITRRLKQKGLRVTPQRTAVLEALEQMDNHPTADQITGYVRKRHPSIATGTVYNILDTFLQLGIVNRVKTDKDTIRYDARKERHHHLYCSESGKIADYTDPELDRLLERHFKKKKIGDFDITGITTQISGRFNKMQP